MFWYPDFNYFVPLDAITYTEVSGIPGMPSLHKGAYWSSMGEARRNLQLFPLAILITSNNFQDIIDQIFFCLALLLRHTISSRVSEKSGLAITPSNFCYILGTRTRSRSEHNGTSIPIAASFFISNIFIFTTSQTICVSVSTL